MLKKCLIANSKLSLPIPLQQRSSQRKTSYIVSLAWYLQKQCTSHHHLRQIVIFITPNGYVLKHDTWLHFSSRLLTETRLPSMYLCMTSNKSWQSSVFVSLTKQDTCTCFSAGMSPWQSILQHFPWSWSLPRKKRFTSTVTECIWLVSN